MRKAPKHKITLMIGVILFAASPFLFFLTPEWPFQYLLCTPEDAYILFGCASKAYTASFYLSLVVFIVGVVLILWSLQVKSKISGRVGQLFRGRYRKVTITAVLVMAVLVIYVILLTCPFTSSWFQYPYYRMFCGREPVIGTAGRTFEGKTYITPEMKTYHIGGFGQKLFCTENGARANGYVRGRNITR